MVFATSANGDLSPRGEGDSYTIIQDIDTVGLQYPDLHANFSETIVTMKLLSDASQM